MNDGVLEADRRFPREEFRRWYEEQPRGRFERVDGRIVAMSRKRAIAEAGIPC